MGDHSKAIVHLTRALDLSPKDSQQIKVTAELTCYPRVPTSKTTRVFVHTQAAILNLDKEDCAQDEEEL